MTERTIARLSVYRRLLRPLSVTGTERVFSHDLAAMAGVTAAQVRRDIMNLGFNGSPARGYSIRGLLDRVGQVLDAPECQAVVLVGVGHLGQALMSYFTGGRHHLVIVAAFDKDPDRVGGVQHGCPVYPVDRLEELVRDWGVQVAIITVPAEAAAEVAERLVQAGVRGLLNFAPARLELSPDVYVENVDLAVSLEKVAYFARGHAKKSDLTWDGRTPVRR